MATFTRVGDFELVWGESLRWDDRRNRLYFVDCGAQTVHWLEGAEPPLHTIQMPTMPGGLVLTDGDPVIAVLDDGLHLVDVDAGTTELLAAYPDAMEGRCNDAHADRSGNLVTGVLNLMPGPGSVWQYSATEGWRRLDGDINNTNGPVDVDLNGAPSLVVSDTSAHALFAWDYDSAAGAATNRRQHVDTDEVGGVPDGSGVDADGGIWSCVLGSGVLARYTSDGLDTTVDTPVEQPSDLCFGGPDLSTAFLVSIAVSLRPDWPADSSESGWLHRIDGLATGRPEPRFRLPG